MTDQNGKRVGVGSSSGSPCREIARKHYDDRVRIPATQCIIIHGAVALGSLGSCARVSMQIKSDSTTYYYPRNTMEE